MNNFGIDFHWSPYKSFSSFFCDKCIFFIEHCSCDSLATSLGEDGVGSCLGVAQMMFWAGDHPPMLGRDSLVGDGSSLEQLKEYWNLKFIILSL